MRFLDEKGKLKAFWALFGLCVLLLGVATTVAVTARRTLALTHSRLQAVYSKSLVDTLQCLDSLETELRKLTVMQSPANREESFLEINRLALRAEINLTQLPLEHAAMEKATRYTNMLADYSAYLAKAAAKDSVTEEDVKNLQAMLEACQAINASLQEVSILFNEGQFDLTAQNPNWNKESGSSGGAPVDMLADTSVEYPALIYDGPFSQSQNLRKPAENREQVTKEQAKKTLSVVWKSSSTGSMGGDLPCYVFSANNQYALVSKAGGLLVTYTNSREVKEGKLSPEEAEKKAEEFLKKLDIGEMAVVWREQYNGCIVFNTAPLQNGAVLYPDLVKVQVALDTGEIVGVDARAYVMAHKKRSLLEPALTKEQAQGKLKSGLQVESSRLALIPAGQEEKLCWEFYGMYEENKFIVYIDAETGDEITVLRIIATETGEMTA